MLIALLGVGAALYIGAGWLPRILVTLTATIIAVVLALKFERAVRRQLANLSRELDYDRKPSRAERRMMRSSMRLAIAKTELRSLLPTIVSRADSMSARRPSRRPI